MILLICIAFILIGFWLLYLNHVYAGTDPIFHSGFVCFTAAIMILCGALTADFQFILESPFSIIFPIFLLIIFTIIFMGIPAFTYDEARNIIEQDTGITIEYRSERQGHNGQYFFYTQTGCYTFDAQTGDYFVEWDVHTARQK